jgi:hypothetical protein
MLLFANGQRSFVVVFANGLRRLSLPTGCVVSVFIA